MGIEDEVLEGEEEQVEVDTPEESEDNGNDPNQEESLVGDDDLVQVKNPDGSVETIPVSELRNGYMRQSDYTRKSQELAEKRKQFEDLPQNNQQEVVEKAEEIVSNNSQYRDEDVETARMVLSVAKDSGVTKELGLLTREEVEAEKAQEAQMNEFNQAMDGARNEAAKMKGMPSFNDEAIIAHMRETGIHNPMAAYKNLHENAFLEYNIKLSNGKKSSYGSDKGGRKAQPSKKKYNMDTEQGENDFIDDMLDGKV